MIRPMLLSSFPKKKKCAYSSTVLKSPLGGTRQASAVALAVAISWGCLLQAEDTAGTFVSQVSEKQNPLMVEESSELKPQGTTESEEQRARSVPELSTSILIGLGGILLIFRKRRTV